ncbi:Response regulatory domain-containing protein [Halomonas sp. NYA30]
MRLDFNVLWVDDQPASVAHQIKYIKLQMAAEGFEFKPRPCSTIDEVVQVVEDHVFADQIDLILVDWDLGNNMHGEDAIERIREIVQYKDVVFYSGQASVVELRKKVYERELEGVYCASREGLVDEVIGVFESLIKKVLDLDHTRGIVMGATSDIDHMVKNCLALAHNKLDDTGKANLIEEAMKRVDRQVKNIAKQGEKLKATPSVEALLKAHMLFTSDHRLRMLSSILGMDEFADYSTNVEMVESYRNGVVGKRNILGHAVLVPNGKPSSVIDGAGETVDLEEMRELRKLILGLRADFRTLLEDMQR